MAGCVCITHLETLDTSLEDEKKACEGGQWDTLGNAAGVHQDATEMYHT